MTDSILSRIDALRPYAQSLSGILRGIEKESLRITADGHLAQTSHPSAIGSALTHPYITTDYSEALLEFITPAFSSVGEPLDYLYRLHQFVYAQIGDEKLWTNSMPCILGDELSIPIAEYGSSNSGRMKTIYRHGLWHRYGRKMQTIAGIHYNFSLPKEFWPIYREHVNPSLDSEIDFVSTQYLSMIRNFHRYSGLIAYLFGASPAVCSSFLAGKQHNLDTWQSTTLYKPYATSLRMSDLGYSNNEQSGLNISYNCLHEYITSLEWAMRTPHPEYEKLGVQKDGQYMQLSTSILQIENEYYGTIRPKRTTRRGERPSTALRRAGVEYIEMRCVDLNPFEPLGIDATQMRFLDTFGLFCLLEDSAPFTPDEQAMCRRNFQAIVINGRDPALKLETPRGLVPFAEWATDLLQRMTATAELLSLAYSEPRYVDAIRAQIAKVENPDQTPSARVLAWLRTEQSSFSRFALNCSLQHEAYFKSHPLSPEWFGELNATAENSIKEQETLEHDKSVSFEHFLQNYFA